MTNHWIDLKNSDCVFVIGANPAENHPASMKWITKAQEMPTAQLREELNEVRARKALLRRTMKDVLTDQFIESMVTYFNCSRKELNFKLALYFQDMSMDEVRDVIRDRQRKFEDDQLRAQEKAQEDTAE